MPFLGQDWRGPGHLWTKAGCSKWEVSEQHAGVMDDAIPRNYVKKIMEAFLRQMLQKKNQSSYTNLTSAPVSKCSVREEMNWLQVGLKSSKEIHGYSSLGEMIRRLDFAGAARVPHRFPYILEIAELLVQTKMPTLSGTAQSHLLLVIEALVDQVKETKREIRRMKQLLARLMTVKVRQSRKSLTGSKTFWCNSVEKIRKWQRDVNLINVQQRMDTQLTLIDLPCDAQRLIVSNLNNVDDIRSVSLVNGSLHAIVEEASTWRDLCLRNYTKAQLSEAKVMLNKEHTKKRKGLKEASEPRKNFLNPSTTQEWKDLHSWLRRAYEPREFNFIDPMLYCKRCSVLFWQVTGHPCIYEVKSDVREVDRLSPRRVVSFFE